MVEGRILVQAIVTGIEDEHFFYPYCTQCYSKLLKDMLVEDRYLCVKCNISSITSDLNWRFRLRMTIADTNEYRQVAVFGQILQPYFGTTANTFYRFSSHLNDTHPSVATVALKQAVEMAFVGNSFLFGFPAAKCNQSDIVHSTISLAMHSKGDNSDLVALQMISPDNTNLTTVSECISYLLKKPLSGQLSSIEDITETSQWSRLSHTRKSATFNCGSVLDISDEHSIYIDSLVSILFSFENNTSTFSLSPNVRKSSSSIIQPMLSNVNNTTCDLTKNFEDSGTTMSNPSRHKTERSSSLLKTELNMSMKNNGALQLFENNGSLNDSSLILAEENSGGQTNHCLFIDGTRLDKEKYVDRSDDSIMSKVSKLTHNVNENVKKNLSTVIRTQLEIEDKSTAVKEKCSLNLIQASTNKSVNQEHVILSHQFDDKCDENSDNLDAQAYSLNDNFEECDLVNWEDLPESEDLELFLKNAEKSGIYQNHLYNVSNISQLEMPIEHVFESNFENSKNSQNQKIKRLPAVINLSHQRPIAGNMSNKFYSNYSHLTDIANVSASLNNSNILNRLSSLSEVEQTGSSSQIAAMKCVGTKLSSCVPKIMRTDKNVFDNVFIEKSVMAINCQYQDLPCMKKLIRIESLQDDIFRNSVEKSVCCQVQCSDDLPKEVQSDLMVPFNLKNDNGIQNMDSDACSSKTSCNIYSSPCLHLNQTYNDKSCNEVTSPTVCLNEVDISNVVSHNSFNSLDNNPKKARHSTTQQSQTLCDLSNASMELFDASTDLFDDEEAHLTSMTCHTIDESPVSSTATVQNLERSVFELGTPARTPTISGKRVKFARRLSQASSIQLIDIRMRLAFCEAFESRSPLGKSCLKRNPITDQNKYVNTVPDKIMQISNGSHDKSLSFNGGHKEIISPLRCENKVNINFIKEDNFRIKVPRSDYVAPVNDHPKDDEDSYYQSQDLFGSSQNDSLDGSSITQNKDNTEKCDVNNSRSCTFENINSKAIYNRNKHCLECDNSDSIIECRGQDKSCFSSSRQCRKHSLVNVKTCDKKRLSDESCDSLSIECGRLNSTSSSAERVCSFMDLSMRNVHDKLIEYSNAGGSSDCDGLSACISLQCQNSLGDSNNMRNIGYSIPENVTSNEDESNNMYVTSQIHEIFPLEKINCEIEKIENALECDKFNTTLRDVSRCSKDIQFSPLKQEDNDTSLLFSQVLFSQMSSTPTQCLRVDREYELTPDLFESP